MFTKETIEQIKQDLKEISLHTRTPEWFEAIQRIHDLIQRVEELEKEVKRLKEYEWMYNGLNK